MSPFETTTPRLLKKRGYQSALFGKFHLGLQGTNPFRYAMPVSLGWDYFSGALDESGDPASIDTTAGGVAPHGTWTCGFVPGSDQTSPADAGYSGADWGACYAADDTCRAMETAAGIPPGRICRDSGGIFDPACPGDGNLDGIVDRRDVADWQTYAAFTQGKSSWYDLDIDGRTDADDLAIIQAHMGTRCPK